MGFNETCAYLHAGISGSANPGFKISYDDHYCKFFEKNPSTWTVELSDWYMNKFNDNISIYVDRKPVKDELSLHQKVNVPAGLGDHSIEILEKNKY
jgi:hypothetical protein